MIEEATPGPSYSATSTYAHRLSKRYAINAIKRLSGQSWSMPQQYGTRPQRKISSMWRTCSDRLHALLRAITDDAAVLENLLENLNWVSLASRRVEAKLVILYRITNNFVDVTTSALTATPTRTRGNAHRYLQPLTRFETYKHSFFPSTIKSWNKCTQQLVSKQSLISFRMHLHSMPT